MTQVILSYEEKILNALIRVGGMKKKPPETSMQYQTRQFEAIRKCLMPLYDLVRRLEDELERLKGGSQ